MQPELIIEEYDQEFGCMTINEVRWLLRKCKRHSPYYTYFLLRAHTGIRGGELLRVRLLQFRNGFCKLYYRVDKPKTAPNRYGVLQQTVKIRQVDIDPWVANEVIQYCEQHLVVKVLPDGSHAYESPHNHSGFFGLMFPWKDLAVVIAYWHKLKHKARKEGMESFRCERRRIRLVPTIKDETHIWRPHMLRHFAATIMYYRLGKDYKAVQKWLRHSDAKTTWRYVHAASELQCDQEYLAVASWAELFGFDAGQEVLSVAGSPQCLLDEFYS